jgi:hypothetical protein
VGEQLDTKLSADFSCRDHFADTAGRPIEDFPPLSFRSPDNGTRERREARAARKSSQRA